MPSKNVTFNKWHFLFEEGNDAKKRLFAALYLLEHYFHTESIYDRYEFIICDLGEGVLLSIVYESILKSSSLIFSLQCVRTR